MAMVANATNARLLRAYAIVLGIAFVAQVTAHGLCWCIAFLGQNMRGLTTAWSASIALRLPGVKLTLLCAAGFYQTKA